MSSTPDSAPEPLPPLLESSGGRVVDGGVSLLELPGFRAEGTGACLVGGFDPLLRFLRHEAELEGTLTIGGLAPHQALRAGALGLAPSSPAWDVTWTVGALLEASAALAGASSAQVGKALERARLSRHRRARIGQLNAVLRRLLALASASVTEPEVLLLERPFEGLNDDAAQFVETVLWELTSGRRWLAVVDVSTPWERRLCEHADAGVFVARGGRVLGPFEGPAWLEGPQVFWVHLAGAGAAEALRHEATSVEDGPAPDTLIVRGLSGRRIAELAAGAGAKLRELVALSHPSSCY